MDQEIGERLVGELAQMRGHFDQSIESLRTEVREGLTDTRRHSVVLAEDLQSKIQLVAEGVAAVRSELQEFRTEVDQRFTEVESRNRLGYTDLDRRLQAVEEK